MSIDTENNKGLRVDNREVKQSTLDFLHELYLEGLYISDEDFNKLKEKGYIKDKMPREIRPPRKIKTGRDLTVSHTTELNADQHIQIELYSDATSNEIEDNTIIRKAGAIKKEDWMPTSIIYHSKAFVDWIDSINNGFATRINYSKFNLYCQQADDWYSENDSITNYVTFAEKEEYKFQEFTRCKQNALYFANKYLFLEEDSEQGGSIKYYANDFYAHQRILCYLSDCKYSFILGKPRQVGGSAILGGIAIRDILLNTNYYTKFITKDVEKGVEIFDHKIKYAYSKLPDWFKLKPTLNAGENDSIVLNDTDRLFRIGKKLKKGGDAGINSRIEVITPTNTAINGGSPTKVLIDEADDVDNLSKMITEGRPTLFKKDKNNKLVQVRQLILLSTGTSKKSNGDFENEFARILGLWKEKEFEAGIIPIFFDWTTRCDEDEYLRQKKYYYGSRGSEKGESIKASILQFHQHYPSCINDMFKTFDNTLIPTDIIQENLDKIKKCELPPAQYGYFKPIYDRNIVYDETSDIPYGILGAEWIPCDELDEKATTIIFQHPKKEWTNRYYQGTDPISSATGLSKMASAVWDKVYDTISAITNIRVPHNTNECYLQTTLLGFYYSANTKPLQELVERNICEAYVKYKERKGLIDSLVINAEIEEHLQTGDLYLIGIDNKGKNNGFIIDTMKEIVNIYGHKIYLPIFWEQHRTFVKTISKDGKVKYGTKDTRVYDDDILFAVAYAYLCARAFATAIPKQSNTVSLDIKTTRKELALDSNNQLYYKTIYE